MDTIFSQKFYSGDYLFVYDYNDNNAAVLLQTNPEISDTPEADIPYEEVVDTMGDDTLDEIKWKRCKICDDSYSRCGEEHEIVDDT